MPEAEYLRVSNHLRVTIRDAGTLELEEKRWVLEPGAKLPTKSQLCAIYGTNTTAIDRAMIVLRTEGWVIGRQGLGVFVADPLPEESRSSE